MEPKDHTPISFRLIRLFCKEDLIEEIEGNLYEYRSKQPLKRGLYNLRYWWEVIAYLRPSTLKMFERTPAGPMFIFNPILTLRNLMKHKSTTFISLFGFIIGLMSVIFLFFYIENELNYDAFHADKDKIYRVKRLSGINGEKYSIGVTSGPYAQALLNDYPSTIKSVNRVLPDQGLITVGKKKIQEDKMIFTDANFFEFFSFPLAFGDPKTVLNEQNAVVISKEIAHKYFGDENPIGQIITVDNTETFMVTGLLDEFPNKSHLDFNMVFNLGFYQDHSWFHGWWNNGLITYTKVNSPTEAQHLNTILPQFMDKYFGEDFKEIGHKTGLMLEPLQSLYFNHETRYDRVKHGNKTNISILGLVALAILFIACFNYVNLSISQSHTRAKEVSIRKVLGVYKRRLILQFMGESVMLISIAVIVSVLLAQILLPVFNTFFGLEVIFNWSHSSATLSLLVLFLGITLSSGLYPALLLSSFQPVKVLKGGKISLGKNILVRKGLVIAQFAISIFLLITTTLIYQQIQFMKNKDLGYDKGAVLVIENNNRDIREKQEAFVKALRNHPSVSYAGSSSGAPGGYHDGTVIHIAGIAEKLRIRTVFADTEYLKILDIPVVAGRGFNKEMSTEMEYAMMLNEKAVKNLGLSHEDVIGKKVKLPNWNMERTIVGIYKDYHFLDLKNNIEPQGIMMGDYHRRFLVKLNGNNVFETLTQIENLFEEFSPHFPISYRFLDDRLAQLYLDEEKQVKVFILFATISILLACLGIFGLASYSAQQRQKELGIRKVLGASITQIIGLISKEFMLLVMIASSIAIPVCWYFMDRWLMDFAYHIDLGTHWIIFLIGALMAFIIALGTVSLKTYSTAASNPTKSIRYE